MKASEEKFSAIYAIVCMNNRGVYVGQSIDIKERFWKHKGELNRGSHANGNLQRDWALFGEDRFLFTIVEFVDPPMGDAERDAVAFFKEQGYSVYNIQGCGNKWGVAEETRRKISASTLGKKKAPDHGAKIAAAQRGKVVSIEARAKMSASHKGKTVPREQVAKISAANTGRKRTPEQRARMSAGRRAAIAAKNESK